MRPARSRRVPPLAAGAWALGALLIAVLAWQVARYRSSYGSMAGMHHHSTADALYRAGDGPLGPLFGRALLTAWHLDAVAVALLVLAAAWYLTGVALVPVRSPGRRWPLSRTLLFFAGLAVCAWATNGSVAVYDQALFTAHMVGHLALVMLAPALIMYGRPFGLAVAASAPAGRSRIERVLRGRVVSFVIAPPVALATYTAVIVGSHLTGVMDVVMRTTWAGQLEHLVYLVVGFQFFVLVVGDEPIRWRLSAPARWLLLAVAMAVDTFTGIVLMQQTNPIAMLGAPGLTVNPIKDTHTGGAIMWFGGDAIMAAVMVVVVMAWLRQAEHQADEPGWLEQARHAAFSEHTGGTAQPPEQFDEDDAARASYNEWLGTLNRRR
ncbi:MAG: copper resistance protein [Pseudonocardiales bacterium]|nr:copper resistance protein [Pseudonocardiales bacterium]